MRVLSGARVDRWRASSGQTPSSVTSAGVETAAACEAKVRVGKGQRFLLPNAVIVNCSADSEQGADARLMQGARDGFAAGRDEPCRGFVARASSRAGRNAVVRPVE